MAEPMNLFSRIGSTLNRANEGLGGLLASIGRAQAPGRNLSDAQARGLFGAQAAGTQDQYLQNVRAEQELQRRQDLAAQLMAPEGLLNQSNFASDPQRAMLTEMLNQGDTMSALQGLSGLETAYNSKQAMLQAASQMGLDPGTLAMLGSMDAESIQTYLAAERDRSITQGRTTFDQADSLRDEFTAQSEGFEEREDKFAQIKKFSEEPSAAGDIAMIFAYMKLLDPNSVVRESEYATAAAAGPLVDTRTRGLYNQLISGERLLPSQRADFMRRSADLYRTALDGQSRRIERYTDLASNYDLQFDRDVLPGVGPRFSAEDLDSIDYRAIASRTSTDDPTMSAEIGQRVFNINAQLAGEAALILDGTDPRDISDLGLTETEANNLIDLVADAAVAAGIDLGE